MRKTRLLRLVLVVGCAGAPEPPDDCGLDWTGFYVEMQELYCSTRLHCVEPPSTAAYDSCVAGDLAIGTMGCFDGCEARALLDAVHPPAVCDGELDPIWRKAYGDWECRY